MTRYGLQGVVLTSAAEPKNDLAKSGKKEKPQVIEVVI